MKTGPGLYPKWMSQKKVQISNKDFAADIQYKFIIVNEHVSFLSFVKLTLSFQTMQVLWETPKNGDKNRTIDLTKSFSDDGITEVLVEDTAFNDF